MSERPLIGVACELEPRKGSAAPWRCSVPWEYTDAIARCGATPVIVPVSQDRSWLIDLYDRLDGIVLPGSDDIPPARYGQEPHPSLVLMPEAEYESWADLLRLALKTLKPVLCICGGDSNC